MIGGPRPLVSELVIGGLRPLVRRCVRVRPAVKLSTSLAAGLHVSALFNGLDIAVEDEQKGYTERREKEKPFVCLCVLCLFFS